MTEQATGAQRRRMGIPLGRPLGIPVYLSPDWLFIGLLIASGVAESYQRDFAGPLASTGRGWVLGIATAVGVALSVLAHELGHSVISLALGIPIRRITLFLFGGYAEISRESKNPREEYLISVAGPLVSLFLGAVFTAITLHTAFESELGFVAERLAYINVALALLNLLPGMPLDGGRVLRAVVWRLGHDRDRATRVAVRGGQVVGSLITLAGLLVAGESLFDGLFTAFIGLFLVVNATMMGRQIDAANRVPHLSARSLARRPVAVPADLPLSEALRRAGDDDGTWIVTVDAYGRPAGVLSAAAIAPIPLDRQPWITVGEVCRSVAPETVLAYDSEGGEMLAALRLSPAAEHLLVDDDGRVAGVLVTEDVVRALYPNASR